MQWLFVGFVAGLLIGGLAHLWRFHKLQRDCRLLRIEITNLEYEINQFKEFNTYCLNHAAGVLLTWEDYKESHGLD